MPDSGYSLPPMSIHPLALFHSQLLEKRGYNYFKFDAVKTIFLANRDCLPPPLSAATWNDAFGAINRHDLKAIINMLDLGLIVPNSQDVLGTSLIARACRLQFLDCVKLLLERGGFARLSDREGRTPLHEAAWFCGTDLRICELLILWDESLLRAADRNGATPLEYVRNDPETIHVWQRFLEANKETMWPLYAAPGRTPEEWACSLYFTKGGGGTAPVSVAGKINDITDSKGKGRSDGSSTKFSTSSTMTRTGRASRSMKVVEEKKGSGGGGGGDKDNKEKDNSKDKDNKNSGTVTSDGPSVTVKSGAGKGGKGHLKKAQESSSTDDKCVSSESLSLSSRSQEGESISTSEGKGSTPHQESLLG